MPGLVLKLGPNERVLVNGVVMQNGARRARLTILSEDANILRLRDAIHPGEVDTPVKRICYIAQLAVAGEAEPDEAAAQIEEGVRQLEGVFQDTDSLSRLRSAAEDAAQNRFYQSMKALRQLLPVEAELLQSAGGPQ